MVFVEISMERPSSAVHECLSTFGGGGGLFHPFPRKVIRYLERSLGLILLP